MGATTAVGTKVAVARAALDDLLSTDVGGLDALQAGELYNDLKRFADRAQGFAARVLAHVETDGRWSAGTSRTFPEWVAQRSGASVSGARREVELGKALEGDLPAASAAVATGEITLEHAQVLARLAPTSAARRDVLRGDSDRNEAYLVDQARLLPVDEYRRMLKGWAASVDEAAAERGYELAVAKEYLTVSRRDDGVALQGFLTVEHGAVLMTALRAVAGVPGTDDDRTHEQRQGTALGDLARLVLDRGLAGGGQQVRPHLSVLVPWETMQRLAQEHPEARDLPAPAELDGGEPIPPSLLARIACDCEISRVVFGPEGQVLDVGRAQRTYKGQIRRAIIARDRRCQHPGCRAAAHLGEIHHVLPWSRLGPTSVENGILLCWFHHDQVHRRGVVITWQGRDGWAFHRADGSPIRGPSRPGGSQALASSRPDGSPALGLPSPAPAGGATVGDGVPGQSLLDFAAAS